MKLEAATELIGGGLGVVLGWWVRWVVRGGVRSWFFYLAVFHARGAPPPLGDGRVFLVFLIHWR